MLTLNVMAKKNSITYMKPDLKKYDALESKLENFSNSIIGKERPIVDGESGRDALSVALKIQKTIKKGFFIMILRSSFQK